MELAGQTSFQSLELTTLGIPDWVFAFFKHPQLFAYYPKLELEIKTPMYTLKTASQLQELGRAFKLRHEVFVGSSPFDSHYDIDAFDFHSDHLIIVDNESGDICGTYRVLTDSSFHSFYSTSEFYLDRLLELPGKKMELGRACISMPHRNGMVLNLLWRGIGEYAKAINAKYLMGCSSIHTTDLDEAFSYYHHLKDCGYLCEEYGVNPHSSFAMDFSSCSKRSAVNIPPLLKSYLQAGAKVYGTPALDKDFHCVDFFTVLDLNKLAPSYKRRYFSEE